MPFDTSFRSMTRIRLRHHKQGTNGPSRPCRMFCGRNTDSVKGSSRRTESHRLSRWLFREGMCLEKVTHSSCSYSESRSVAQSLSALLKRFLFSGSLQMHSNTRLLSQIFWEKRSDILSSLNLKSVYHKIMATKHLSIEFHRLHIITVWFANKWLETIIFSESKTHSTTSDFRVRVVCFWLTKNKSFGHGLAFTGCVICF